MKLLELIKIAFSSLRTNKLRSFLTILGIVVGIFSIIAITTVVAVLQSSIEDGVSALGKNTFQIQKWPIIQMSREEFRRIARTRKDITLEEFKRLKENLPEAESVGAEMWQQRRVIKYGNKETNPIISLSGCTPGAFPNNGWYIKEGREFNQSEMDSYEEITILGADVAKTLFDHIDPINKHVKVDNHRLKVIGVLESQGDFFGQSQDNFVIIPVTTFQKYYGKRFRSINITVMSYDKESYQDLIEKAAGRFRIIRKVPPTEPDDFTVRTNQAVLDQINGITAGVKMGAYVIGAIALLAAGIGIMNIMLVSVTERTREIGIRKSIGAKRKSILTQFLVEAVTLCLFGGAIGIFLGILAGNLAGVLLSAKAIIPIDGIMVGVSLCILIGIIFGTYPAYKASNLDPIEALRYE